jgi:hypothetical protein
VTRGTHRAVTSGVLAGLAAIAVGLSWWFVPAGPDVSGPGAETGVGAAYVGNHYSFPTVILARSAFVVSDARLHVAGQGCQGDLRFLPHPPGPDAVGVSAGALPGASAIGQRITPRSALQLSVVLTPSKAGKCAVDTVDVAARSWGKDRWRSVSVGVEIQATRTGSDPRGKVPASG